MATSDMNAICSQLLTPDDLALSDELFKEVLEQNVVTKILDNKNEKYVKIFSKEQIFLSNITPVLHDIGFVIKDEVTYNIRHKKDLIYITRFNLHLKCNKKIDIAKDNIENIVTKCLSNNELIHSKAFSLVYEENFDYRKILLIRAIIEYLDQSVLTVNSTAILNTFTSYHSLTAKFVEYFMIKFDPSLKSGREKKLKDFEEKIREEIKKFHKF